MPKYAEEILAAVTELQQHPTAEQRILSYDLKIRYICPDCREQEENNAEGGAR